MIKPVEVKPLSNFRIRLKYNDGVEGEVDLSRLAGKGVFAVWNEKDAFKKVYLTESGGIAWSDSVELCSDSMYLKITGKKPEDMFPALRQEITHA